jgi:hypothetical protein
MKNLIKGYGKEKSFGYTVLGDSGTLYFAQLATLTRDRVQALRKAEKNVKVPLTKNFTGGLVITKPTGQ